MFIVSKYEENRKNLQLVKLGRTYLDNWLNQTDPLGADYFEIPDNKQKLFKQTTELKQALFGSLIFY